MVKTSVSLKREKIIFLTKRLLVYGSFIPFIFLILPQIQDCALGRVYFGLGYCLYLLGMFYLVGKEVDYRLKIYFRTNSSVDRMLYRFFSGYLVSGVIFYLFSFFPEKVGYMLFWTYWLWWGVLYAWPTRAKILKEPFFKQVSEFRYLDKFEKLLVFLCLVLVVISIPYFQEIYSLDLFVNHHDPSGYLHPAFWNSLEFSYKPIMGMGLVTMTSWFMFFYFMTTLTLLLVGYCLFRFFFNRRLSLLGVFSMASSWALVLTLESNAVYGAFISSFAILWVWGLLWIRRSATYRSGLFIGLLSAYGYILYTGNLPFFFVSMLLGWFVLFKDKTKWFRKQFVKYAIFGLALILVSIVFETRSFPILLNFTDSQLLSQWSYNFTHKDFYILSILGLILITFFTFNIKGFALKYTIYNRELFEKFLICLGCMTLVSVLMSSQNISYINNLWIMGFCALVPLEWLFQAVRRLRSQSNLIYGIYIVICLLDSRIEGRIKNIAKFLDF